MNDVRWLRSRILAALSVPAIGLVGCAAHEVSSNATGPDVSPRDAARKSLCATWKKGRSYTWCTSAQEAQKLAHEKSKLSLKCPDHLDHDKVKKALKDEKFERGHSRRTDVILLHEKTKTASNDCQENICCYVWATRGRGNAGREIIRGRPLLAAGTAHTAPLTSGKTWSGSMMLPPLGLQLSPLDRELVAAFWLDAALAEHASVASFSRATLELMAVGAPSELLRQTSQGALDEIDHALRCFSIAEAYGAAPQAPAELGPTASRPVTLEDVAVHTFLEGCVVETIAALEAVTATQNIADKNLQECTRPIAEDETRHSELAWQTLSWLVSKSPKSIGIRLEESAPSIRARTLRVGDGPAHLECHGILSPATRHDVALRAWDHVITPALSRLGISLCGERRSG